jgi:hypothetical protein
LVTKTPAQLREDAQAYRALATHLGGAVMSKALSNSAERLEQQAAALEWELNDLLPPERRLPALSD